MKDSTKRRIAFEIGYFCDLFKFRGLPLVIGAVLKVLSEDYLNIVNRNDFSGGDASIMLIIGLAITLPLLYIPYIIRLAQWVKKTNGDKQYKVVDWKNFDFQMILIYILLINLFISASLHLWIHNDLILFGVFNLVSYVTTVIEFFVLQPIRS